MSKSIGRYVKLQGGYAVKSSDYRESGIPLIRISNVSSNGIDKTNVIFVPKQFSIDFKEYLASEDDTLIAMSGATTGKCCLVKQDDLPCIINQRVGRFLINDANEVDKKFVYYIISSYDFQNELLKDAVGGAQPNVSPKQIEKINWDFPLYNQQKKIAKILSTTDAVIEKTQAAIAKYKAIKQGMLHDLFTRGIDITTGKLRPKQEDAPELYKESELGWIPKEWEDCKLGKYITHNLYGPRFNARDYFENGNVKTIRGTDFTKEGEILYHQAPKALLLNTLINAHKLEDGDIVIVTTADCGLTAVFKKPINDVDFIPSAYSVKYRFANNVNSYFIKYFMSSDFAIRQVNKFVRQGTLGNLPGSDIMRFDMAYPSENEQNEIAERLLKIDKKLFSEQSYLLKLQQIKAGLMADLLSGKKLVTVPSEIETQTN